MKQSTSSSLSRTTTTTRQQHPHPQPLEMNSILNQSEGESSTIEAHPAVPPGGEFSKRMDGANALGHGDDASKRSLSSSVQVGVLVGREVDKLTRQSRMLKEKEDEEVVVVATATDAASTTAFAISVARSVTPSCSIIHDDEDEYKYEEAEEMAEKAGFPTPPDDPNRLPAEVPLFDRREVQAWTLLGNGAFSEVYQIWDFCLDETPTGNALQDQARQHLKRTAMDASNRCNYVIKHLRGDLLGPGSDKSRFVHAASDLVMEALFLSKLDHPNIIKLRGTSRGIDTFGDGSHVGFFLVLDRLDCTLADKIGQWARHTSSRRKIYSKNLYDYRDKIDIALQIARGLDFLHDRDIIFRDLKPDNIGILDQTVKIFDFGLCRELPEEKPVDNKVFHMSGVGTRRYMAPEIFLTQYYNLKVDVYSFAMVLHCMLSLTRPFEKYNAQLHTLLVCKEGVRPPIPHEWPSELRDLLRYGWAHRPTDRPSMKIARQVLEGLALRAEASGIAASSSPTGNADSAMLLGGGGGGSHRTCSSLKESQRFMDRICAHPQVKKAGIILRNIEGQMIRGAVSTYPIRHARIASESAKPKEHPQYRKHLRSEYRL